MWNAGSDDDELSLIFTAKTFNGCVRLYGVQQTVKYFLGKGISYEEILSLMKEEEYNEWVFEKVEKLIREYKIDTIIKS
jgi:hypothetical protein